MQNPLYPHLTTKHRYMVRLLLVMLMISIVLPANSQRKKEKEKAIEHLFSKAEQGINSKAWEEAISSYKEITKTVKKTSDAYARAV